MYSTGSSCSGQVMVELWPKVLRMTSFFLTKFAASVFLDIFVISFYGILKYN